MTWLRRPLRNSRLTSVRVTGGAARVSSTQRTWPPCSSSSGCEKNQSASRVSALASPEASSPATSRRPSARRRSCTWAPSITSCSKPRRQSERTEKAASTRGTFSPASPSAPSALFSPSGAFGRTVTPCRVMTGISPLETASMRSAVTLAPIAREARRSSRGRKSSIRGTMNQCKKPHATDDSSTSDTSSHSSTFSRRAASRKNESSKVGHPGWHRSQKL